MNISEFINQLKDTVLITDCNEVVVDCNREAESLFCGDKNQILQKSLWNLLECSPQHNLILSESVSCFFNPDSSWRLDCIAKCFDGSTKPLSFSISETHYGGESRKIVVIRDISKWVPVFLSLKSSEAQFRALFEEAIGPSVLVDLSDMTVSDCNKPFQSLTGISRENLLSLPFALIFSHNSAESLLFEMQTSDSGTCKMIDLACGITVSINYKRIEHDGKTLVFTLFKDISEQLRVEKESRDIQSKLIYTNKMTSLGLLVAGVAHEINNPNNYIMANAEVLLSVARDAEEVFKRVYESEGEFALGGLNVSELKENLHSIVESILDGSKRIRDIVSELKDYSRHSSDAWKYADLNKLLDSSMLLVRPHVSKYTDKFEIQKCAHPTPLYCIPQQIEQLLINLILNALESINDRSGYVKVRIDRDDSDMSLAVTITDEGCGILPEYRETIFEPFFTTRIDRGGTGLGLSIAAAIVKTHSGRFEIYDNPESRGTVVKVYLPLSYTCEVINA